MRNDGRKPRLVGINHVALEVTDVDAALDFWKHKEAARRALQAADVEILPGRRLDFRERDRLIRAGSCFLAPGAG